ncbi:hypothetical protein CEXT_158761 [Caerostris extrusa]|uniref:Reverse transcriptase domain-containing protein n=1 Tax=Caerostris extrusa TaxID=172846 RepID=A0AAV4UKL1_CAEEX|nr:hypothetical protein CEXT_158761 [Caerostris extrusa]
MVKIQNCNIELKKGLRQRDSLSTCWFNIFLEYVMRKIKVNLRGTIFNRTCQFWLLRNDLVLLASNQAVFNKCFLDLFFYSKEIGLSDNSARTKYMINTRIKEIYQREKNFEYHGEIYES